MSKIGSVSKYIQYRRRAFTDHDLHSPFVFDLYTELIRNKWPHYDFDALNKVRAQLLRNTERIRVTDFGAGSRVFKSNDRLVKDIARYGISRKKYAEFIYRLANKFAPVNIVELGTSLGLSALYLARACPSAPVYTIEGCDNLFRFSEALFRQHQQTNIIPVLGHFDEAFPKLLSTLDQLGLLYVDGNHAYEPTMRYFNAALAKKNDHSIFIFDDIHWSDGMERAWDEIRQHPEVTLTLDLFHIGIVFFRKEQKQKEHFVLRY